MAALRLSNQSYQFSRHACLLSLVTVHPVAELDKCIGSVPICLPFFDSDAFKKFHTPGCFYRHWQLVVTFS